MHKQLLTFLLAPVAISLQASPRIYLAGTNLLARQTTSCGTKAICEDRCMPIDAVCCEDGSSTYCQYGNRCVSGGCCPIGKIYSGVEATMTHILPTETSSPSSSSTSDSSGSGSGSGSGLDESHSCNASALDWAALVATAISVNITWWLFDIPKLWKHGLRAYLGAVCWQCLRISMPSVAGICSIYHATELHDLPKIYYYGFDPDDVRRPMTFLEYLKALSADTLTVLSTSVTIYKACHMKVDKYGEPDMRGWNSSYWAYPTLPVALIGFWLLAVSLLKLRNIWAIFIGGFLALAIPCVTFSLILYYLSPLRQGGNWFAATFTYIYLSLPFALIPHVGFQVLIPVLSVMARTGVIAASAMSSEADFPFCKLKNNAFGATYLAFGILAGLLAIYGRFKWDRVRYVFMPKSWWGNRNARYGPREDLSWNAFVPHAQKAATRRGDRA